MLDVTGQLLAQFFSISISDRIWPPFLLIAAIMGTIVYVRRRRRGDKLEEGLIAFLLPRTQYLTRSSVLDAQIFAANRFLWFGIGSAIYVAEFFVFTQLAVIFATFVAGPATETLSTGAFVMASISLAMMRDLATYAVHRSSHEWSLLWPFHAVHHSAESLTPLTVYRKHPVYDIYARMVLAFLTGPPIGVLFGLLGGVHPSTVIAAGLSDFIFNILGSNLRHTHIWLGYGWALSHVFVSPAMHQIHHSTRPEHRNRNYGEIFALWDWAFGTLYVPAQRENITYGLVDPATQISIQPHPNLSAAYFQPFRHAAATAWAWTRGPFQVSESVRSPRVDSVPPRPSIRRIDNQP